MSEFRFNARQVFLTYAQCPVAPEDALTELENLLSPVQILAHCIGREQHQDGEWHLHAYLRFNQKFNTRNPRAFDFNFGEDYIFHPNIRTVRSAGGVIEYCIKDGQYIINGVKLPSEDWGKIITGSETKEDFLSKVNYQ